MVAGKGYWNISRSFPIRIIYGQGLSDVYEYIYMGILGADKRVALSFLWNVFNETFQNWFWNLLKRFQWYSWMSFSYVSSTYSWRFCTYVPGAFLLRIRNGAHTVFQHLWKNLNADISVFLKRFFIVTKTLTETFVSFWRNLSETFLQQTVFCGNYILIQFDINYSQIIFPPSCEKLSLETGGKNYYDFAETKTLQFNSFNTKASFTMKLYRYNVNEKFVPIKNLMRGIFVYKKW